MATSAVFVLSHSLGFVVLVAAAFLAGRVVLPSVAARSRAETIILSVPLGIGVLSHLVLALGLADQIFKVTICAAFLLWVGLIAWRRALRPSGLLPSSGQATPPWRLVAGVGLVMLLPVLALALYPPTAWDATEYYLASSKLFVSKHGLVPTPYLRVIAYTHLPQMLFVLSLLFQDDVLAQLAQSVVLLSLAGVTGLFAGRLFSPRAGALAAALVLGTPLLAWLGSVAYIDLAVALFMTLSAYAVWRWLDDGAASWLHLAAAFGGFAASTKYNALPFLALLFAIAGIVAIRRRSLGAFGMSVLILVAVGAPYYVRNAVITGDPMFPMLPRLFGYSQYSPEDVSLLMREVLKGGIGHGLRAWVTLPWAVTFQPEAFRAEAPVSPFYLLLTPVLAIAALRNRRLAFVAGLALFLTAFWLYNAQILRHLVPAFPILAVAMAGAVEVVVARLWQPRWRVAGPIVLAGAVALLVSPSTRYARPILRAWGPLPATPRAREAYLTRLQPSYPAYQFLNRTRGANYRVYALLNEDMPYFADGIFMGDWFGPARFGDVLAAMASGQALHTKLRDLHADFFLVNTLRTEATLPADDFFHGHFRPVFAGGGVLLFELLDGARPWRLGPNLLRNPGFEQRTGPVPVDWDLSGAPRLEHSEADGVAAVCTGEHNVYSQKIALAPGRPYVLGHRSKAGSSGALARLQINYVCPASCPLVADVHVVEARPAWTRSETIVVPPEGATSGIVYASPQGNGTVLFDDFYLSEIVQ